ncbi:MAG: AmmeMemoRadiSam system protein B [Nanopusillaceae archaeon]
MIRKAIAKGFYSFNKNILEKEIENCFLDPFGPKIFPKEIKKTKKLIAGIVPHAGYIYSGPAAAFLYKELYENWDFDTIVIIGTNHTGYGNEYSLLVSMNWETPLGIVKTDKEFGKELINTFDIFEDELAHLYEHSIEVQLPFLQYFFKENFKIVPIVVRDENLDRIRKFVKILDDIAKKLNRKIFVLISSDFTHHGEYYDYYIFKENISENVRKLDMKYIEKIISLDSEGFLKMIYENKGTVCGYSPILVFIEYTRLKNGKVELLKYYNSGEKTGEEDFVVGYASIISYL